MRVIIEPITIEQSKGDGLRISKLAIENFRSIEDITLDLPQVCALVGPNNAGKSNILEALRRVLVRVG